MISHAEAGYCKGIIKDKELYKANYSTNAFWYALSAFRRYQAIDSTLHHTDEVYKRI